MFKAAQYLLVAVSLTLSGCSRTSLPEIPSAAHGDDQGEPDISSEGRELTFAIQQAELHLEYGEFSTAEEVITEGLREAEGVDKSEALTLLSRIKAASQENELANAPVTPDSKVGEEVASESEAVDDEDGQQASDDEESNVDVAEQEPVQDSSREEGEGEQIVIELQPLPEPDTPSEKEEATDTAIASVIKSAAHQLTPQAALEMLRDFANRFQLSEDQQKTIDEQIATFEERLNEGLVRNGDDWIAEAEAKEREAQADTKVEQALKLIAIGDVGSSIEYLKEASEIDKNGIRADFALGLIYSMRGHYRAESAESHFRKVLSRVPDHVPALNNLALAKVKQREFGAALTYWKTAATISPTTHEVIHNVGRVVSEGVRGRIPIRDRTQRRFTDFYAQLAVGKDASESDTNVGWLYVPLLLPKHERDRPAGEPGRKFVTAGWGTGFVVFKDYVVTNKHVIRSEEYGVSDKVTILDPNDPAKHRQLDATVVAQAVNVDLALLRCPELKTRAMSLQAKTPGRGSSLLVLGYPQGTLLGNELKLTQGIVTALPNSEIGNFILTDAEIIPGNSGGPICDDRGNVVAVATWVLPFESEGRHVGKFGGGIPASQVQAFLQRTIAEYEPVKPNDGDKLNWTDVDSQHGPSVVLITSEMRSATMNLTNAVPKNVNYFEDRSCSVCNGSSLARCRREDCRNGEVRKSRRVHYATNPSNGVKVYRTQFYNVSCPTCGGDGHVSCPACRNGVDPSL